MITLPRWASVGLAAVIALYTVGFAAISLTTSARPVLDAVAAGLFVLTVLLLLALGGRPRAAAVVGILSVAACGVVPALAASGLDPRTDSYSAGAWWVTAVACIAVVLLLRGRPALAGAGLAALAVHTVVWSGVPGLIGFGVAAVGLLVGVAAVASWAMARTGEDMARFHAAEREAVAWQAAQDAYHFERQVRLARTGRVASAMLERIAAGGTLTEAERQECRLLEQTIRDEIRGRELLNDALRSAVLTARRRGAVVQVLDDGGLEGLPADDVDRLRDAVAAAVAPLDSTRIVIRTAPKDSDAAVTVVATTVDATAAALGLDDGEEVDLWLSLGRPAPRGTDGSAPAPDWGAASAAGRVDRRRPARTVPSSRAGRADGGDG